MADLATLASSNFPTGTEAIGNSLDNYIRSIQAILRSTYAVASATLASASTTDIGSADGESVIITGNATINSFGTGYVGCYRELRFTGTPTIVAGSNIALPSSLNITVGAGESLTFRCTASGGWTLVNMSSGVRRFGDTMTGRLINLSQLFGTGRIVVQEGGVGPNPTGKAGTMYFATGDNATQLISADYGAGTPLPMVVSASRFSVPGVNPTSEGTLPASTANAVYHTGGYSSPIAGRTIFGDASGWLYSWATRVGGVTSSVMSLTDQGNLTAAGNITAFSDENLKKNWCDVEPNFVARLAEVKSGTYDRKDICARQAGVSAQSLRDVLPETVMEGTDGALSVAYGNAALVAAVALAKEVVDLQSRLDRLGV
ncbi:tail fiber domain-containing protein [Stenotrophomonas maltophilia]|uniref:tail fiber domain-containing protein n=1 Tax=Stenotrophomonas maltophilia TaxID=40324 RepID=UPI003CF8B01F